MPSSASAAFRSKYGKYLPHQRFNVDQYDIDKDTSKHNLALESYGEDDGWVLLEPL